MKKELVEDIQPRFTRLYGCVAKSTQDIEYCAVFGCFYEKRIASIESNPYISLEKKEEVIARIRETAMQRKCRKIKY